MLPQFLSIQNLLLEDGPSPIGVTNLEAVEEKNHVLAICDLGKLILRRRIGFDEFFSFWWFSLVRITLLVF